VAVARNGRGECVAAASYRHITLGQREASTRKMWPQWTELLLLAKVSDAPECRGYGAALLRHVLEHCDEEDSRLLCVVSRDNEGVLDWWRRRGVGRHQGPEAIPFWQPWSTGVVTLSCKVRECLQTSSSFALAQRASTPPLPPLPPLPPPPSSLESTALAAERSAAAPAATADMPTAVPGGAGTTSCSGTSGGAGPSGAGPSSVTSSWHARSQGATRDEDEDEDAGLQEAKAASLRHMPSQSHTRNDSNVDRGGADATSSSGRARKATAVVAGSDEEDEEDEESEEDAEEQASESLLSRSLLQVVAPGRLDDGDGDGDGDGYGDEVVDAAVGPASTAAVASSSVTNLPR